MANRLFHTPAFTDLSCDRESLDVTESLRRQVDALSAENQRLREESGGFSWWHIIAALGPFLMGLSIGLQIGRSL